jgi:hypothetical protein
MTHEIIKNPNFVSQVGPWGGTKISVFDPFRVQTFLGHLWGAPEGRNGLMTSPESLRDPLEHQFLRISHKWLLPVFFSFCRFGVHSWHGGGGWPAGQLDTY